MKKKFLLLSLLTSAAVVASDAVSGSASSKSTVVTGQTTVVDPSGATTTTTEQSETLTRLGDSVVTETSVPLSTKIKNAANYSVGQLKTNRWLQGSLAVATVAYVAYKYVQHKNAKAKKSVYTPAF